MSKTNKDKAGERATVKIAPELRSAAHPENMLERCLAAYFRRPSSTVLNQPSRDSSDWDGDEFVLRNVRGELARYRYSPKTDRLVARPVRKEGV